MEAILDKADSKLMTMITSLHKDLNYLKNDMTKLKENGVKNDVTNDKNLVHPGWGNKLHYVIWLIFIIMYIYYILYDICT